MSKTHLDVDMEAELEGIEDSDEDMDKVNTCMTVRTSVRQGALAKTLNESVSVMDLNLNNLLNKNAICFYSYFIFNINVFFLYFIFHLKG